MFRKAFSGEDEEKKIYPLADKDNRDPKDVMKSIIDERKDVLNFRLTDPFLRGFWGVEDKLADEKSYIMPAPALTNTKKSGVNPWDIAADGLDVVDNIFDFSNDILKNVTLISPHKTRQNPGNTVPIFEFDDGVYKTRVRVYDDTLKYSGADKILKNPEISSTTKKFINAIDGSPVPKYVRYFADNPQTFKQLKKVVKSGSKAIGWIGDILPIIPAAADFVKDWSDDGYIEKENTKNFVASAAESLGAIGGAAIGSAVVGAACSPALPAVGTAAGTIGGSIVGGEIGGHFGKITGEKIFDELLENLFY